LFVPVVLVLTHGAPSWAGKGCRAWETPCIEHELSITFEPVGYFGARSPDADGGDISHTLTASWLAPTSGARARRTAHKPAGRRTAARKRCLHRLAMQVVCEPLSAHPHLKSEGRLGNRAVRPSLPSHAIAVVMSVLSCSQLCVPVSVYQRGVVRGGQGSDMEPSFRSPMGLLLRPPSHVHATMRALAISLVGISTSFVHQVIHYDRKSTI
jgi:hypothetical protein